jgi:hypothetical protein
VLAGERSICCHINEKKGVKKMKHIQLSLSLLLLLLGVVGYTPIAALAQTQQVKGVKPGVIAAMPLNKEGTFCHLRFPAIAGRSFGSANPQLKPLLRETSSITTARATMTH